MTNQALKDRKILVTGAGGFIGHAVCRHLLHLDACVYGLGRSQTTTVAEGTDYSAVDLTDADSAREVVARIKPDYVIHLAGCSVARREPEWIPVTFAANLLTTVNLLLACEAQSVKKTIIAGSLEQPAATDDPAIPTSPYAASKWAATGYARMFNSLYGTRSVTARIFMVYGPGQAELQKLVPYVCLSTIAGRNPELMSGTREVDWIYVDDVAHGLVALLDKGPDDGSLVDIGTGRLVTTGEVAQIICRSAGDTVQPEIGAVADRKLETERKADVARTRELTGWSPGTTVEDGLRQTLEWYQTECSEGRIAP